MKKIFITLFILLSVFTLKNINASPISDLYNENNDYLMPSTGDVNALALPICFKGEKCEFDNNLLEKSFNNVGYKNINDISLKEYYLISSNNKLNITTTILEPYVTEKSSSHYDSKTGYTGVEVIIYEYFKNLEDFDYSKYDLDNDGKIDALYLIYNHKVDQNSDFYWAFTANYNSYKKPDYINNFCWFGYNFLTKNELIGGAYNSSSVIIHETGHLLGLEDYYDYYYDIGANGGLGYYDMMDANVGDHNAFSKLILGWYNESNIHYINTTNYEKENFTEKLDDETILIISIGNFDIYNEYFIVEYISPKSILNTYLTDYLYDDTTNLYGFKVYHIMAKKGINDNSSYPSYFYYNNSDTKYKLIDILEADNLDNSKKDDEFMITGNTFFKNESLYTTKYNEFSYYNGLDIPIKLDFSVLYNNFNFDNEIKITMLDNKNNPDSPKIINLKDTYEVNKNGTLKKPTDIKAYNKDNEDITDKIELIGYYNEQVSGTYKLCYKITDNDLTSYYYFDVIVNDTLDNSFMSLIYLICIISLILTTILCIYKLRKNKIDK